MGNFARIAILLAGCALFPSNALHARVSSHSSAQSTLQYLQQYSFSDFVKEFNRDYEERTEEWARREQIFGQNKQYLVGFHTGAAQSWTEGITKFMDQSKEEFKAVLGYRGRGTRFSAPRNSLVLDLLRGEKKQVPASFSLVQNTSSLVSIVRDQGSCGSCWAEAAISVLEGHMERHTDVLAGVTAKLRSSGSQQTVPTLSSQALVSCTPNPRNCGGKGGCQGATAELAFEMVKQRGMPLAVDWSYVSGSGSTPQCKEEIFSNAALGIKGYKVLPSNKANPLMEALVKEGAPIVVSVDAGEWAFYMGGIFSDTANGRSGSFTVNHAVVLTGFQTPGQGRPGYWTIKNSWGTYWGESGFIRLEMKQNEDAHCGWDYNTHDGLACDGDPDTAWVCGTCGVLYDSSYPTEPYIFQP
mmetsp:Transcript_51865/g.157255  ORF Transcript_51865/g.157255 Transcript_51865/m.157255 type:complete len:413 (-) Transcript_51865:18-1256(-)